MGVDADYLCGYMAKVDDIEWDIEYLKDKFDLNKSLPRYLRSYTFRDIIESLENDSSEFDYDEIALCFGLKYKPAYDEYYYYFKLEDLKKAFPEGKLKDMDDLSKEYAKQCGVKNCEIFKWDEFGYFS